MYTIGWSVTSILIFNGKWANRSSYGSYSSEGSARYYPKEEARIVYMEEELFTRMTHCSRGLRPITTGMMKMPSNSVELFYERSFELSLL